MITVYTTPTCVYCHALMDWLDEIGVKYSEKPAEEGVRQGLDISAVPVTQIGDEVIVGFDRPAIKKALKKQDLLN